MYSCLSYVKNHLFDITKKIIKIFDDYFTFNVETNKCILFKNDVIFNFNTMDHMCINDDKSTCNKNLLIDFKFNFDDNMDYIIQIYINLFEMVFLSDNDIYLNTTIDTYNIITKNLKSMLNNHYLYDTLYPPCVYNMEIDVYKNRKISSSHEYLNKGYNEINVNNINLKLLSVSEMEDIFSLFTTQLLLKKASDIYILCVNVK